jgi:hypothetical protein
LKNRGFIKPLIYLGCPYSLDGQATEKQMERRHAQVTRCANVLFRIGLNVYSPITMHHQIQQHKKIKMTTRDWLQLDYEYLRHSEMLYVLKLDGWDNSLGLVSEIEFAQELDIPIVYIEPNKEILG